MRSIRVWTMALAVCAMSSVQPPPRIAQRSLAVQLPAFEMTGILQPPADHSLTLTPFEMTGVRQPPLDRSLTLPPFEMTGVQAGPRSTTITLPTFEMTGVRP